MVSTFIEYVVITDILEFLLHFWGFCSSSEIPQYRLPYDVVQYEIDLIKNLGVKFLTGRKLSTKDLTVEVSSSNF